MWDRTGQIIVGSLVALDLLMASAWACSESWLVFFDFGSDRLSTPALASVEMFRRAAGGDAQPTLPAQCVQVTLVGHIDSAEADANSATLGLDRAAAVRESLISKGFSGAAIEVKSVDSRMALVPTGPGVREPQNRRVELFRGYGNGRWRCDPAVERLRATTCVSDLSSCYFELTDGTVCNFHGVPDPNPAKYSVDSSGEKLK